MDNALMELVNAIKNVAPTVWQIMVKQVQVDAWIKIMWTVLLFVSSTITVKFSKASYAKYKEEGSYSSWDTLAGVLIAVSIGCVLVALITLTSAIQDFANPEFQAIRLIIEQIKT